MNKNALIEILNSNQELLQDLAQSEFLQNNLVGMLRNVESIIPEDSRDNFYTNLKTLRLNFEDETMIEQQHAGAYSRKNNEISMDKSMLSIAGKNISRGEIDFDEQMLMGMYHELLHMASTTRDEFGGVSGYQDIHKDENGELLYADILEGMTEGFTEYLALLAFDKQNHETSAIYGKQINLMNHLSMIVGLENMKKAYFNNRNGMEDIEKVLKQIDGKFSHTELYANIGSDFRFNIEDDLFDCRNLSNTDKQLLELSNEKIEYMKKLNPNLSEEYIKEYWSKVSLVINSRENLQLMDEAVDKYKGLDEVTKMFEEFSGNKDKGISTEEIEKVTKKVKSSDINTETSKIKDNIKDKTLEIEDNLK